MNEMLKEQYLKNEDILIIFYIQRIFFNMFVCHILSLNWCIFRNRHTRISYCFIYVNFFKWWIENAQDITSRCHSWGYNAFLSFCIFASRVHQNRRDLWKAKLQDKNRDYPIISYLTSLECFDTSGERRKV